MYCEKCGRLAHGERPCGGIATIDDGAYRPPIVTQPTMIVVAPPNRRLESGGWFARSFMTTTGVIAALLAPPACCVVMMAIALVTERIATSESPQFTKDAKRIAMQSLERHGVDTLSSDSMASRSGTDVLLTGSAKMKTGTIKPYAIRFRIARFGSDERWSVVHYSIDGNVIYSEQ